MQPAAAELELRSADADVPTCSHRRRVVAQVKSRFRIPKKMCVRPRRYLHGRGATIALVFTGCITTTNRYLGINMFRRRQQSSHPGCMTCTQHSAECMSVA